MTSVKNDANISTDKKHYQQLLNVHLAEWEAEVAKLNKLQQKAKGKSKHEIIEHIDELKEKIHEGKMKLQEVDEADENLWEIIKEGIEAYWELLKISIEEIIFKYKH